MSDSSHDARNPESGRERQLHAVPAVDSELLVLIARMCDGLATREDCRRLDSLLSTPEAIDVYCAAMEVHSSLAWLWTAGGHKTLGNVRRPEGAVRAPAAGSAARTISVPSGQGGKSVREDDSRRPAAVQALLASLSAFWSAWSAIAGLAVWPWLAERLGRLGTRLSTPTVRLGVPIAAITIGLLALAASEYLFPMPAAAGRQVTWPAEAIAVLSGVHGAEVSSGGRPVRVAEVLPVGTTIELVRGLAEITYRCGATVVVDGPASVVVCGDRAAAISRGRLSARVDSSGLAGFWKWFGGGAVDRPPLFSVHTPRAVVHDRGTEFGVTVGDGGDTAVRVFSGSVDFLAVGKTAGRALRLWAGESAGLAATGQVAKRDRPPQGLEQPLLRLGTAPVAAVVRPPQTLRGSLRYYQPCDDLEPRYPGEQVHPNPQLEPGLFGQAFRIEQRWALNLVQDADLGQAEHEGWIAFGEPRWLAEGGRFDPACAEVDRDNYLRQVVGGIEPGTLCCASVYARCAASAAGSVLVLSAKCGGKSVEVESQPLSGDYARVVLPFKAEAEVATLAFTAKGDGRVVIDGVQLEAKGRSFPRSFNPKQKEQLITEWVDIPARPDIFDARRGTIAFWTRPDWVGQTNSGSAFFGSFFDPELPAESQHSHMALVAHSNPEPAAENDGHAITVEFRSRSGRLTRCSVPLDERFKPGAWVHVAVTWRIDPDGESSAAISIDGRRAAEQRFAIDGIEPPTVVRMGYSKGGYADGLIDEFCLFDRPLSDGEVAELAARNKPLLEGRGESQPSPP